MDITTRKIAEEKLSESEANLRVILESTNDGILAISKDGKVIKANRRFAELWRIPSDILDSADDDFLIKYVLEQLIDPDEFMRKIDELYDSDESSYNYIYFKDGRVFERFSSPIIRGVYKIGRVWSFRDITEKKKTEELLLLTQVSVENSMDAVYWMDSDANFIYVNDSASKALGYSKEELLKMTVHDIDPNFPAEVWRPHLAELKEKGSFVIQSIHQRKNDSTFPVEITVNLIEYEGKEINCAFAMDITERKQAEQLHKLSSDVLSTLNKGLDIEVAIDRILSIIQLNTGFDAIGIRLEKNGDYPYYVQTGFSDGFLKTENTLWERTNSGDLCRDKDGNISLECTCGLVISGKADLNEPYFTNYGSFWTNDSLSLLELTADEDPRHNPRNRCIHSGFMSVALIPLRIGNEIVGLLQLNDRRKNSFTEEMIRIFEGLSNSIGIALLRNRGIEELKESENRFRRVVNNISDALIVDDLNRKIIFYNTTKSIFAFF